MIRYIAKGDNAGKVLKWETVVASGIGAITLSGLARAMRNPITEDIKKFSDARTRIPGVERFDDSFKECDIERIVVSSKGDYISISYSICVNRISSKDIEFLCGIGFIEIMD